MAKRNQWPQRTIGKLFWEVASSHPDQACFITPDQYFTYRAMQDQVLKLAKGLRKMGVKKGDNVAVWFDNLPQLFISKYALSMLGAVNVPINSHFRTWETEHILKASGAVALITMDAMGSRDYVGMLYECMPELANSDPQKFCSENMPNLKNVIVYSQGGRMYDGMLGWRQVLESGQDMSDDSLQKALGDVLSSDIYEILYTSGTTGLPKGAIITHDMGLRVAEGDSWYRHKEHGTRNYSPLPLFHSWGEFDVAISALSRCGTVITSPSTAKHDLMLWMIQKYRVNDMIGVPPVFMGMLDHPEFGKYDLSSLRSIGIGAAPPPIALFKACLEQLAPIVCQVFGHSECCGLVMSTVPYEAVDRVGVSIGREIDAGPAGMPELRGSFCEYKVWDLTEDRELPEGEVGELVARGPVFTQGYYKNPEETAKSFRPGGWWRTGDIGFYNSDSRYFEMTGRAKELIIVGGENVASREVEIVIEELPEVRKSYVFKVPDERLSEVPAAWIELKQGVDLTEQTVREHCRKRISGAKTPRYIKFISESELPTTATGKAQKFKMSEVYTDELGLAEVGEQFHMK